MCMNMNMYTHTHVYMHTHTYFSYLHIHIYVCIYMRNVYAITSMLACDCATGSWKLLLVESFNEGDIENILDEFIAAAQLQLILCCEIFLTVHSIQISGVVSHTLA